MKTAIKPNVTLTWIVQCSWCKRFRVGEGHEAAWLLPDPPVTEEQLQAELQRELGAEVRITHGQCPECAEKFRAQIPRPLSPLPPPSDPLDQMLAGLEEENRRLKEQLAQLNANVKAIQV